MQVCFGESGSGIQAYGNSENKNRSNGYATSLAVGDGQSVNQPQSCSANAITDSIGYGETREGKFTCNGNAITNRYGFIECSIPTTMSSGSATTLEYFSASTNMPKQGCAGSAFSTNFIESSTSFMQMQVVKGSTGLSPEWSYPLQFNRDTRAVGTRADLTNIDILEFSRGNA